MSRRIFLTGATGFVGRQVLRSLLDNDVSVVCAVREGSQDKLPASSKVERCVLTSDLFAENESWWKRELEGIDIVVHVAWYAEPGKYQSSQKNLDCLIGTLNMARAAAHSSVKRFVVFYVCCLCDYVVLFIVCCLFVYGYCLIVLYCLLFVVYCLFVCFVACLS